jgi:hypothetical protein
MTGYVRTSRRTGLGFGCVTMLLASCLVFAVLGLVITVGGFLAVLVIGLLAAWLLGWVMTRALWTSFSKEYGPTGGAVAVGVWWLLLLAVWQVVAWL